MILAILEKRLGIEFRQYDVFINIAGGIYINDPAVDLAIAAALISSYKDYSIDSDSVFIGEIGLTGEIRPISNINQRIIEAEKLGFKEIYLPKLSSGNINSNNEIKLNFADRVSLAMGMVFK